MITRHILTSQIYMSSIKRVVSEVKWSVRRETRYHLFSLNTGDYGLKENLETSVR